MEYPIIDTLSEIMKKSIVSTVPIQFNNCSDVNGVITATTDDNRTPFRTTLQAFNNNSYVKNLYVWQGVEVFTIEFEKDNTFNRIWFGHSGSQKDIKVVIDVSFLPNGIYYFKYDGVHLSGNRYAWKNMIISRYTDEQINAKIDEISHKIKIPTVKYVPYSLINSLNAVKNGAETQNDLEILRHYLTPLGIGGI